MTTNFKITIGILLLGVLGLFTGRTAISIFLIIIGLLGALMTYFEHTDKHKKGSS